MRAIKNPHVESVQTIYGPDGAGTIYEIQAGRTVLFPEELYEVADHFLSTFGFLEEVETKETKKAKNSKKHICQYCQRDCKTKLGLEKHEKKCEKEHPNAQEDGETIKPKGKMVPREVGNRSQNENNGFGNSDMQGIATGQATEEKIGGRKQRIVYDRDGVGWYGPGIQDDRTPATMGPGRRPGQFN